MHHNTKDFAYAQSGVSLHVNMSDHEIQADHVGKTQLRKAGLQTTSGILGELIA
jgi:hypothetical protein